MSTPLHEAQASILYSLRHAVSARFSDLRRPTGMDSDAFKFHVRKLQKLGYIEKLAIGTYALTLSGKEYANNLAESGRTAQKQPKLSMLIVAASQNDRGETVYLMQQRLRNPFYSYWGLPSGPIGWGEDIEDAARREFAKQTGLGASFAVRSFYRKKDFAGGSDVLLEDKLFAIVEATDVTGTPASWDKGVNKWLPIKELEAQYKYFSDTSYVINACQNGIRYITGTGEYNLEDY